MTSKVSHVRERYEQTQDKKGKSGSVIALRRLVIISSLWDSKGNSAFGIFRNGWSTCLVDLTFGIRSVAVFETMWKWTLSLEVFNLFIFKNADDDDDDRYHIRDPPRKGGVASALYLQATVSRWYPMGAIIGIIGKVCSIHM